MQQSHGGGAKRAAWLWTAVGLAIVVASTHRARRELDARAEKALAEGVITANRKETICGQSRRSSFVDCDDVHYPSFRLEVNGETFDVENPEFFTYARKVGSKVAVRYDAEDPRSAAIDSSFPSGWSVLSGLAGAFIAMLGIRAALARPRRGARR